MRHHAEQRSGVGVVNEPQFGLVRIERRPLLGVSGDRLTVQSHLRADCAVVRRPPRIDIQHRIKAALANIAVQIEPLARRIDPLRRDQIPQSLFGDLHRFFEMDQLIDIVRMKKKRHKIVPSKTNRLFTKTDLPQLSNRSHLVR